MTVEKQGDNSKNNGQTTERHDCIACRAVFWQRNVQGNMKEDVRIWHFLRAALVPEDENQTTMRKTVSLYIKSRTVSRLR